MKWWPVAAVVITLGIPGLVGYGALTARVAAAEKETDRIIAWLVRIDGKLDDLRDLIGSRP